MKAVSLKSLFEYSASQNNHTESIFHRVSFLLFDTPCSPFLLHYIPYCNKFKYKLSALCFKHGAGYVEGSNARENSRRKVY